MSQFETDRENQAVGEEVCPDCLHDMRLHGPDGCEFERGDSDETGCALGPCGCSATTLEPIEDALGQRTLQGELEVAWARYRAPSTANLIQQRSFPSPLVGMHKMDFSWNEL